MRSPALLIVALLICASSAILSSRVVAAFIDDTQAQAIAFELKAPEKLGVTLSDVRARRDILGLKLDYKGPLGDNQQLKIVFDVVSPTGVIASVERVVTIKATGSHQLSFDSFVFRDLEDDDRLRIYVSNFTEDTGGFDPLSAIMAASQNPECSLANCTNRAQSVCAQQGGVKRISHVGKDCRCDIECAGTGGNTGGSGPPISLPISLPIHEPPAPPMPAPPPGITPTPHAPTVSPDPLPGDDEPPPPTPVPTPYPTPPEAKP